MKRRKVSIGKRAVRLAAIVVRTINPAAQRGRLLVGGGSIACALGRGGVVHRKREGDGATPAGAHPIRRLWHRGPRTAVGQAGLPARVITRGDGWCDAPADANYNRPVRLPYPASAERMWRDDGLYRYVVEIGWNDGPRRRGRGSAIFLHVARPGYAPTEGCVAIAAADFRKLLPRIGVKTRIVIGRGDKRKHRQGADAPLGLPSRRGRR